MKLDIVICGVGGQGSVLASRALARAAMEVGLSVRTSEVIGMAQREGPVTSHVRMGHVLHGGIVPDGGADVLLGLELAETVRGLVKLKSGGSVLAADTAIVPVSVYMGLSSYDRDALRAYLKERVGENLVLLDAEGLARRAGHRKTVNIVMLGALSALSVLPFAPELLLRVVLDAVPAKFREVNRRAFELGRQAMEGFICR